MTGIITTRCPVHIIQGMQDPDVPYSHALTLLEHLPSDDVILTLIRDGDHRLSRPQDIERLLRAVAELSSIKRRCFKQNQSETVALTIFAHPQFSILTP